MSSSPRMYEVQEVNRVEDRNVGLVLYGMHFDLTTEQLQMIVNEAESQFDITADGAVNKCEQLTEQLSQLRTMHDRTLDALAETIGLIDVLTRELVRGQLVDGADVPP